MKTALTASWMWLFDLNYDLNVIVLLNFPITKLSDNNLASELLENRRYLLPITVEGNCNFMINGDTFSPAASKKALLLI